VNTVFFVKKPVLLGDEFVTGHVMNADPLQGVLHSLPGQIKRLGVVVLHPQVSAVTNSKMLA